MYARPSIPKKQPQQLQEYNRIVGAMEERLNLSCFICSHIFNTTNRIPKIVCKRQHTYCAECLHLIQKSKPMRCPECRFKIYDQNIFVNRAILSICQYFPVLRKEIDQTVEQNDQLKTQNQELLREILRLKNQLARGNGQIKKQKTVSHFGQQEYERVKPKAKTGQILERKSQKKKEIVVEMKGRAVRMNPESLIKSPQTLTKYKQNLAFQPQPPQMNLFNPLVRNYGRKQDHLN